MDVIRWIFNLRNVIVLITEVFLEYILAIFYVYIYIYIYIQGNRGLRWNRRDSV